MQTFFRGGGKFRVQTKKRGQGRKLNYARCYTLHLLGGGKNDTRGGQNAPPPPPPPPLLNTALHPLWPTILKVWIAASLIAWLTLNCNLQLQLLGSITFGTYNILQVPTQDPWAMLIHHIRLGNPKRELHGQEADYTSCNGTPIYPYTYNTGTTQFSTQFSVSLCQPNEWLKADLFLRTCSRRKGPASCLLRRTIVFVG